MKMTIILLQLWMRSKVKIKPKQSDAGDLSQYISFLKSLFAALDYICSCYSF